MSRRASEGFDQCVLLREKQRLKQHCRRVTILQSDLASRILTAKTGQLPCQHVAHYRNFVPEHLSLTEKDLAALAANGWAL